MPEYIMPDKESSDFQALDEFTRGYTEALFFTEEERLAEESENLESGKPMFTRESGKLGTVWIPGNIGFELLSPEALEKIKADCESFQGKNKNWLESAYSISEDKYTPNQAGIDFWFSRNGHGAGYFDRKNVIADTADKLQDSCGWRTAFPEITAYIGDDGKIYLD